MKRLIPVLLVAVFVFAAPATPGKSAGSAGTTDEGLLESAVGQWKVEFANGVTEVCRIGNGGEANVEEPLRSSNGLAAVQSGAVAITFHDDRIERWTPVGKRFVVEHFFPGSRLPLATPVLGIAERVQ